MVLKADLHCHIEAAARPAVVRAHAERHGLNVSRLFTPDGRFAWHDFASFLTAYDLAAACFRTPEDYADLAEDYFVEAAREGMIYGEIFASIDHAATVGLSARDYLTGLSTGITRARAKTGVEGRIIVVAIRHLGPERAVAVARETVRHGDLVVGFGMAGEERLFHPADFAPAFDIARAGGLAITVHAGEWGGPESVAAALDHLKPSRIGHGVRAIEDANLVRRLADEGIVLEVCPGSNIALSLYPDRRAHPFAALRAAGVRVTLGADDPPWFNTTIGTEYAETARALSLCGADMKAITKTAIEAAFCDADTKARLISRLKISSAD